MRSLKTLGKYIGILGASLFLAYCGGNSSGGSNGTKNHAPEIAQYFDPVYTDEDVQTSVPNVSSHFSDPNGDILTYNVSGFNKIDAVLNGDKIDLYPSQNWYGTETGQVEACDPHGLCNSDALEVIVNSVNDPPVADAGNDSGALAGITLVNLDGSGSYDVDGTITNCEWDYTGNGSYDWSSTTTCSTKYMYPNVGNVNATLRVTDNDGAQSIDTKLVEVE